MNKINIDNIMYTDEIILLENKSIRKIKVSGKCQIDIINSKVNELIIEADDNSSLLINYFNIINKQDSKIDIKVKNKSSVIFNHSFKVLDKYNLDIKTDFLGKESGITVNLSGLNDGAKTIVDVKGYVKKNKNNNVLDENMRFININNGTVMSNPNMYIDTSLVIANHNTAIGGVSSNELFYLMSKGLSKEESVKLICNGFLINKILSDELRIKVKEVLN